MIVDVNTILAEIGPRFAGGKPITISGRELVGYTRKDGTVFKRWVPRSEAPDVTQDYVEFGKPEPPEHDEEVVEFVIPALERARKTKARR